jgi:hypothetical protein
MSRQSLLHKIIAVMEKRDPSPYMLYPVIELNQAKPSAKERRSAGEDAVSQQFSMPDLKIAG